jgi:hypothetical protein
MTYHKIYHIYITICSMEFCNTKSHISSLHQYHTKCTHTPKCAFLSKLHIHLHGGREKDRIESFMKTPQSHLNPRTLHLHGGREKDWIESFMKTPQPHLNPRTLHALSFKLIVSSKSYPQILLLVTTILSTIFF